MHILPLLYNILRSVLLGGCCKILENYFSFLFYMPNASSYQIMECNNEASNRALDFLSISIWLKEIELLIIKKQNLTYREEKKQFVYFKPIPVKENCIIICLSVSRESLPNLLKPPRKNTHKKILFLFCLKAFLVLPGINLMPFSQNCFKTFLYFICFWLLFWKYFERDREHPNTFRMNLLHSLIRGVEHF